MGHPVTKSFVVYKQSSSFSFPNGSPVDGDYWILDTDYETYSVVYSCSQVAFLKLELGWVLTREENPPEATVSKLYF